MKVAIVHDYLVNKGGAERVVLGLRAQWPDAPIFTSLYAPALTYDEFQGADVRTSRLQRHLDSGRVKPENFRRLLPLFPGAFRAFDLRGFDVVVSSSSGFAHHVRPPAGTCHICYAYSPPRFLWNERDNAIRNAPRWARPMLPPILGLLRRRDLKASKRPHFYLAVSDVAKERIQKTYDRTATTIHPPVWVERYGIAPTTGDFHLVVSRLVAHRNVQLAVRAFTEMGRKLVVVGDGPARPWLETIAGNTVEFRGSVDDATLLDLYARCRGVVVPGEEDFGLAPIEANASGRPVIAFGKAGALETTIDGTTGVLFTPANVTALRQAVDRADGIVFDPIEMRTHAEGWSVEAFTTHISDFVERSVGACINCARERRDGKLARLPIPRRDRPAGNAEQA